MSTVEIPLNAGEVVDRYFLEHRAKLIDIAAFLDRVDRAGGCDDHRMRALGEALGVVSGGGAGRARRVLEVLSDPTDEVIDKAGAKGATGAHREGNGQ